MATEPKEEFRFDHKRYETKHLTVEKLDALFESFTLPVKGLDKIIIILKLVAFALYAWTRRGLVNDQMLIEKQEYERKRIESQRGDIAQDDLDQLRRQTPQQERVPGDNS